MLELIRQQHRSQKEQAQAQRNQMLAELRDFRGAITKLMREEVPALVKFSQSKLVAKEPSTANTAALDRGQHSTETVYSSLPSLKCQSDGKTNDSAKSSPKDDLKTH